MDDDGDDKDDCKRRTRNLSEKKRRDQFNLLVSELSTMVSTSHRKMDKSTVLKATIAFLKNHNDVTHRSRAHDVQADWKPIFLSNEEFTYLLMEALECFILVFTPSGMVRYVSESIASLLGHNPSDMVNRSVFDLVHEDDRAQLYALLQTVDVTPTQSKGEEMQFQFHLRRGSLGLHEEATTYELVQCYGQFRTSGPSQNNARNACFQQGADSRVMFTCTCRLQAPLLIRDVSLVDHKRNEFISRHSLEWKFLFLDHRAPPIIGYLPFEVLGTSGYDYYHFDDLEKVVTCHEELMEKGELTSCYYRFLTKGQQWIWLQTRFYITYHQWNAKPEFVVCTHRVISNDAATSTVKTEGDEPMTVTVTVTDVDSADVTGAPRDDMSVAPSSPSALSDASEAFGSCKSSRADSVKSMSVSSMAGTAAAMDSLHVRDAWANRRAHSDSGSMLGEPRASRPRYNAREEPAPCTKVRKEPEPTLMPQHTIEAQYLEPTPYMGMPAVMPVTMPVSMPVAVPVPLPVSLPTLLLPEQQVQYMDEQLHRKHEELQQMIVRQQAELRQVKEQLLLARLGILPPLINVQTPYVNTEEMHSVGQGPPQMMFDAQSQQRPAIEFPTQQNPHTHMPQ